MSTQKCSNFNYLVSADVARAMSAIPLFDFLFEYG